MEIGPILAAVIDPWNPNMKLGASIVSGRQTVVSKSPMLSIR